MKKCPFCGKEIQDEAIKCKYCRQFLKKPASSQESNGARTKSKITPEQKERMQRELAYPEVRPCAFDVTFSAWLHRISVWGRVRITHVDPENRFEREVSQDFFIKRVTDFNLIKYFGKWLIVKKDINKVNFLRKYIGIDGKKYTEKFLIVVELRPELKKTPKWRKFW